MKAVIKRLFSFLFSFVMILGLTQGMGLTALADDVRYMLWVGNTEVTSACTSGEGWSYHPENHTLILNNATLPAVERMMNVYDGPENGKVNIFSMGDLTIELQGKNTLTGPADIGIYVIGNLTLQGTGSLTVTGATNSSIRTGGSGYNDGNLAINSGTVQVSGAGNGIYAYQDLTIAGGTISASATDDAIYARFGSVVINGGTVTAESVDGTAIRAKKTNDHSTKISIGNGAIIEKPKNGKALEGEDHWCIAGPDKNNTFHEARSVKIVPGETLYSIAVSDQVTGGTVVAPNSAKKGDVIQLKAAEGSAPALLWEVEDADGDPVSLSGANSFTMPAINVTVFAWFAKPTVTIEFGENHTEFASFYRQKTGFTGTGSKACFSLEAGKTIADALTFIQSKENVEWLTDERRHDENEILDINQPYTLKPLASYASRSEAVEEIQTYNTPVKKDITLYAPWLKPAGSVSVTVVPLEPGTTVSTQGDGTALYRTDPIVTATVTGNASQDTASSNNWYSGSDFTDWFSGIVEENQTQFAGVYLKADFGYYFENYRESVDVTNGIIHRFDNDTPNVLRIYASLPFYTVSVTSDGHGTGTPSVNQGRKGTEVTLSASPEDGYRLKEWQVLSGGVTVTENKLTIGASDVVIKAEFEEITAAVVSVAPTARALTYNGQAQELVTAGTAEDGEMQYALGADTAAAPKSGWSADIPAKTDTGTYYVWYYAKGDANHLDSEPVCLTVTISGEVFSYSAAVRDKEHTLGDEKGAVIIVSRSARDDTTFDRFVSVTADDGKPIDPANYTTARGSLILTLRSAYLDTLPVGNHKVTINFTDGSAEAMLKIKAAAPEPTATTAPTPTPKPRKIPKTGDSADPALWLGMILLGLVGIAGFALKKSRQ